MPGAFSAAQNREAERAAKIVPAQDDAAREDLRKLRLITIDGADARDFDDAVFCAPADGGGFVLWAAIADVAAFVPPGGALDLEARRRGNSVYLPDRVLPMLPSALSNGACSLASGEDKLCLACEMEIRADGTIQKYRFMRGLMRSKRRMTYPEAAREMRNGAQYMRTLAQVGDALRRERRARGAFMMERPELQAALSANGAPELQVVRRNEAHLAIEECMIAANRCAADFVIRRRLPALHRVHKKPAADNVKMLRAILSPLGISFPARPAARDFGDAMDSIAAKDAALADCLLPVLLGALSRAEYAPDSKTGHFGLACARYLHWTSPIRRYPDLLSHRAILAGLAGDKPKIPDLREIGAQCSQSEVAADKAGWDCRQKLLCWRAQNQVGREYEVMISGAAQFGVFVFSPELGVDGMLRLASMPGYWTCDAEKRQLTRRGDGRVLGLGAQLRARLVSVSPEKGRANFEATMIYDENETPPPVAEM